MAKKKQSALDKLLGRNKPEEPKDFEFEDFGNEKEDNELEVEEFMEIGGSPVPGITLRQILRGHTGAINRIAWSPDGRYLASPSDDNTIRIWDVSEGKCISILEGHISRVNSVAWSPNGNSLVSGSDDNKLYIWGWDLKKAVVFDVLYGHRGRVHSVHWSPDGYQVASGSNDKRIIIWDANTKAIVKELQSGYDGWCVKWSPNGNILASGSQDEKAVALWDKDFQLQQKYSTGPNYAFDISWSHSRKIIAVGFQDKTIKVFDSDTLNVIISLEGHTKEIVSVSFSANDLILASKSKDGTIQLWRTDNWAPIITFKELGANNWSGLAFHPLSLKLATLSKNNFIRIWELDKAMLLDAVKKNINYITAKLVLVGDSGVGKTGLGWRLAHNEFKEHSSTHGQQFWTVPELKKTSEDGTECEAVLWDLAGQHIYRSIHSIFLDDVDASLVLFDPTNRQEPLKGAQFWLEQLKGKNQLPPSVLVGARLDRGAPVLSQQELDQFCQKYGISGGYIGTSAKNGEGLEKLVKTLQDQIPWDQMTTTVTTVTFKRIKEFVLSLKEKPDRKGVLVKPDELRKQLQATDKDWQFTDAEMMTAVGHLANHGYVTILKSSSGEEFILLVPELLASVASSIFLHADKHPRELGAINETDLLQGKYPIEEFKGLEKEEQHVLLDATVVRFLEHSLCFREALGNDNLLIFPSLIKQKRPLRDDVPATDGISYIVRGRVENIYASLVVLLGYTSSFTRINQWANQAQYETDDGDVCGFRLVEDREGEIELILYYANAMEEHERNDFQSLFEQFLYQRDVEVTSFPPVVCPKGHQQERATVVKRLREGKTFLHCEECGEKTDLPSMEPRAIGIEASSWLQIEEAKVRLRNSYESHLLRVKAHRRNWTSPRCYISCIPGHIGFANRLKQDLKEAGIYIIENAVDVQTDDMVIVLDCPVYQDFWKSQSLGNDIPLIKSRLSTNKLVSMKIDGNPINAHDFKDCQVGDFCDETHYPISLFNLVLNLYAIQLTHPGFAPLRAALHQQWGQSLAKFSSKLEVGNAMSQPLKVFISYAHKDEEYKNELMTMLAGLERRGVLDIWQDREIEEGDEWLKEIEKAMNECELALLFISPNFINSRFIQGKEVPRLLQRRKDEGLHVVPIILDHCLWESEPVLSDLQAMPRDAKPIITFPKENGERTLAWKEIAQAVEKRAKK